MEIERDMAMKHLNSLIYPLVLIALVLLGYHEIFGAGINNWDDEAYVFENPDVHAITAENLSLWFSKYYIGNYHPLTMLSYAVDWQLGDGAPFQFHLTNILLHLINAILVFLLVKRLTSDSRIAFFVAALFAIHPVQTESVSWIAERKNVLYGCFFLASCICYLSWVRHKKWTWLLAATLLGISSMLSKAAALPLPFAWLALDVYLGRDIRKVWMEKMLVLIPALVVGFIGIQAQEEGGFLNLNPEINLIQRLIFAGYAYTVYILTTIAPVNLSVWYPFPRSVEGQHIIGFTCTLLILALGIRSLIKGKRVLSGSVLWYSATIFVVLQLVQFGESLHADRYLYLPLVGILIPLVYYPVRWFEGKKLQPVITVILTLLLLLLVVTTYQRNKIWLSERNFWMAILDTYPNSGVAQYSMGAAYLREGDYINAEPHLNAAVRFEPSNYKAWYNKGVLHLRQHRLKEALESLNRSLDIQFYEKAIFTRALVYQQAGRFTEALADANTILNSEPANPRAHFVKADALEQSGRIQEAVESYSAAINYEPDEPMFRMRRGIALAKLKAFGPAEQDLSMAIEMNPGNGAYWYWRGLIKRHSGKNPCDDLQQAIRLGFGEARGKGCD